jgi:hypothetical protein
MRVVVDKGSARGYVQVSGGDKKTVIVHTQPRIGGIQDEDYIYLDIAGPNMYAVRANYSTLLFWNLRMLMDSS